MDYSHWDLHDEFSIQEAACLYCGLSPTYTYSTGDDEADSKIDAVRGAIVKEAIIVGHAPWDGVNLFFTARKDNFKISKVGDLYEMPLEVIKQVIDLDASQLSRGWLVEYFKKKGQQPEFLFPANRKIDCTFNKLSPTYPPELDAAIQAWRAAISTDGKGKPKAKIKAWLDKNTDLSNEAKERIATVANWDKTGGATRTE